MKQLIIGLITALLVFSSVIPFFSRIYAQGPSVERIVTLEYTTIRNEDYFAAGNIVNLDGTVNGDAYVAGGTVTVRGKINGDLLIAGGTVTIPGDVTGNIRGAGGNILITGHIGKNITLAGGTINIMNTASVGGSLVSAGGNITVSGPVKKGVIIAAGSTYIDTSIGGNLMQFGELTLSKRTKIKGNLMYRGSANAQIPKEASIGGVVKQIITPSRNNEIQQKQLFVALGLYKELFSFLSTLIVGILLFTFLPNYMKKATDTLMGNVFRCFGIGVLSIIFVPLAFIILLITIIGAPLALLLLGIYIIVIYFGKFVVVYAIGERIAPKFKQPIWQFILGLLLYHIVGFIPILGSLMKAAVFLIGVGVVYHMKKQWYMKLRKEKIL